MITSRAVERANERPRSTVAVVWVASPAVWATMISARKSMRSVGGNETSSMVSHADVVLDGDDVFAG